MTIFDWVVLAVLACSMMIGAGRGFVFEVLSVLGWIVAFVAAQWLAPQVAQQLPMGGATESVRYVVAFAFVFVLAAFACGLLSSMVKRLVQAAGLSPVDRVLGTAFGLVRGAILILALGVVISSTPLHQQAWWQESAAAGGVTSALHALRQALPAEYARFLP
jgi:membrane protein required for colicin V production